MAILLEKLLKEVTKDPAQAGFCVYKRENNIVYFLKHMKLEAKSIKNNKKYKKLF
jgi:hypothetical protein